MSQDNKLIDDFRYSIRRPDLTPERMEELDRILEEIEYLDDTAIMDSALGIESRRAAVLSRDAYVRQYGLEIIGMLKFRLEIASVREDHIAAMLEEKP